MSKMWASLLSLSVLMSSPGCGQDVEHAYDSLAEMRGKDASSLVAAIHVPADAQSLQMKLDPDSDRFHVSYATADATYSIARSRLSSVDPAIHDEVLKSLGFGVELSTGADVFVGCRNTFTVPAEGGGTSMEALLLANLGERQHQWNMLYKDDMLTRLCGTVR